MGMRAIDLGLGRKSLMANPKGNELLYHLRLVEKGNHKDVKDLKIQEVSDTDECEIFYKGKFFTKTSTNELYNLITSASFKTMKLVEVRTPEGLYYAAIHEALLERKYVGVLTDEKGRVVSLVQAVENTLWGEDGRRLIKLEEGAPTNPTYLSAQDSLKYINKNLNLIKDSCLSVVLF